MRAEENILFSILQNLNLLVYLFEIVIPHNYKIIFKKTNKDDVVFLMKQILKRLDVQKHYQNFITPTQLLALWKKVVRPCKEYASNIWGGSTHSFLEKVEAKAFRIVA